MKDQFLAGFKDCNLQYFHLDSSRQATDPTAGP